MDFRPFIGARPQVLRMLHDAVRRAVEEDDSSGLPPERTTHLTRSEPDWKKWSDALEYELTQQGASFEPIRW